MQYGSELEPLPGAIRKREIYCEEDVSDADDDGTFSLLFPKARRGDVNTDTARHTKAEDHLVAAPPPTDRPPPLHLEALAFDEKGGCVMQVLSSTLLLQGWNDVGRAQVPPGAGDEKQRKRLSRSQLRIKVPTSASEVGHVRYALLILY